MSLDELEAVWDKCSTGVTDEEAVAAIGRLKQSFFRMLRAKAELHDDDYLEGLRSEHEQLETIVEAMRGDVPEKIAELNKETELRQLEDQQKAILSQHPESAEVSVSDLAVADPVAGTDLPPDTRARIEACKQALDTTQEKIRQLMEEMSNMQSQTKEALRAGSNTCEVMRQEHSKLERSVETKHKRTRSSDSNSGSRKRQERE